MLSHNTWILCTLYRIVNKDSLATVAIYKFIILKNKVLASIQFGYEYDNQLKQGQERTRRARETAILRLFALYDDLDIAKWNQNRWVNIGLINALPASC